MKKHKIKNGFLAELRRIPIVQVACERSGISRNSVYRWRNEDAVFQKEMDKALEEGEALVNDMSESQLLTMIREKNWSAVSFWLRHRNPKFRERIEIAGSVKTIQELPPDQKEMVTNALKLADLALRKNEQ
ncbi:MAG: hypothetical protein WC763_01900 [Candidatus Paceibacterota bacterium]|jgi:hypothetical protein